MSGIEMVTPAPGTGTVAPLVEGARKLVLSDPEAFDLAVTEIRRRIDAEVAPFLTYAHYIQVKDTESYEGALLVGQKAARFVKRIEELLDPLAGEFYRPWKNTRELIASFTKPLEQIKTAVTDKAKAWDRAEKARVAREQREAEALKQKVADDLAAKGKTEAAAAVMAAEVPVAPAATQKVEGVSTAAHWTWELVDFDAVLRAVCAGSVPKEVLALDTKYLNRIASAVKDTVKWDGLRFFDEGQVRFR